MKTSKTRYPFIDEVRGFLIICMIFYHAFYVMARIFNFNFALSVLKFFMPLEPFFAASFIFVSGFCSVLSRSVIRRGIKLLVVALLLTAATYALTLVGIYEIIKFGVLHFLALSMILGGLVNKFTNKQKSVFWIFIYLFLFLLFFNIEKGFLGIGNYSIQLPSLWYTTSFLFPLGLANSSFYSADFFPLLPWIFIFFLGIWTGKFFKTKGFPEFIKKDRIKFLSFVGRKSLIIYVLHQPIIYILVFVFTQL